MIQIDFLYIIILIFVVVFTYMFVDLKYFFEYQKFVEEMSRNNFETMLKVFEILQKKNDKKEGDND